MIGNNSTGAAVSANFLAAMTGGYNLVATVEVWSSAGQKLATLPVSTGTVTVDRKGQQRRRVALTVEAAPGSTYIASSGADLLAPYGNELRVYSGVQYSDGTTELVAMGVYPFTTSTFADDGRKITVTLDGYDRSWLVSRRKFSTPYAIASGTDVGTAGKTLINSVYSGLAYNITPTTGLTTPGGNFKEGDDPWASATALFNAVGYEVFFDVNGTVVARPAPTASTQATAWNYTANTVTVMPAATSGIMAVTDKLTRDNISNDFIVSGAGTGVTAGPVRAQAQDTTSTSPTYVSGAFGDVPTFVTSNLITTTAQAQQVANNLLTMALADAQQITVSAAPNPLLDVDDVVSITNSRLLLSGARFVIDSISHPLSHTGKMTFTGRRVP